MRKRSALIALCAWWLALMAVIAGTEGKALFKTKPSDVHLDDGYAMRYYSLSLAVFPIDRLAIIMARGLSAFAAR